VELGHLQHLTTSFEHSHYKEKVKQRQLILTSGGGFELPLIACCGGFQASQYSASLGHLAAVLATAGITASTVFCGGFVCLAAVYTENFKKNILR
jgi:hypothetical protein